jgi:hypothetical protein
MTPEEKDERERLAATPNLPSYTRRIVLHSSTPLHVARQLVALASPNPAAASAAQREAAKRAERLDREMRITGAALAGFDPRTQTQSFGARRDEAAGDHGADESVTRTFGDPPKGAQ